MFDFSQVSPQSVGFAVFVGLLALRSGLLWVGLSGLIAMVVASDHLLFLSKLAALLETTVQWASGWMAGSL